MNLIKFNPFVPVNERFGNALEHFFNGSISEFIGTDFVNALPRANVIDNEKSFEIEVAAPGLTKEDFEVNVEEGHLVIKAEATSEKEEEGKYTRREFSYRSFSRSFALSDNIDQQGIVAKYDGGVLKVTLPKLAIKENLKTIEVS